VPIRLDQRLIFGKNARAFTGYSYLKGIVSTMLSPTTLAGLSVTPDWVRPVRAVSPPTGQSQGASQQSNPLTLVPLVLPGLGDSQGGTPSRTLPRGSMLDLSV